MTNLTDDLLEQLIRLGMKDGSIRRVEDPADTALSISFSLFSIAQRIANNYDALIEETDSRILNILTIQKQFFLDALVAKRCV